MRNTAKVAMVLTAAVAALEPRAASADATTITEISVANGEKRYLRKVTRTVYTKVCNELGLEGADVLGAPTDDPLDAVGFGGTEEDPLAAVGFGGTEEDPNLRLDPEPCFDPEWVPRTVVAEATLHDSYTSAENRTPYNWRDADVSYKGCGIAAAQKLLAFWGIKLTQDQIRAYIPTWTLGADIAVVPNDLRDGIARILAERGGGLARQVAMSNWLDEMTVYGRIHGNLVGYAAPTIVLVNNGSHYIVTFGWRGGEHYYYGPWDVTSNHAAVTVTSIDSQFYGGGIWASFGAIFSQAVGYTPGTVIAVR